MLLVASSKYPSIFLSILAPPAPSSALIFHIQVSSSLHEPAFLLIAILHLVSSIIAAIFFYHVLLLIILLSNALSSSLSLHADYFSCKIILFIAFSLLLHNLHLALLSLHELFY
jgi:hypothetical protein